MGDGRVPEMTGGRVQIGSGTLYTLLEQFLAEGIITETQVQGRRRSYLITEKGKAMLEAEVRRLEAQLQDYRLYFGKEDMEC